MCTAIRIYYTNKMVFMDCLDANNLAILDYSVHVNGYMDSVFKLLIQIILLSTLYTCHAP